MDKKRILVVEDELVVAENLRRTLTEQGFDVIGVTDSGEQAIKQGLKNRPDLVLMDIVLPGRTDGISAAHKLRSLGIPVIYLTAHSNRELLDRAQHTHPLAYLKKPVRTDELAAAIQIALYKQDTKRAPRDHEQWETDGQSEAMAPGVPDYAILTIDCKGKVSTWNEGAEKLNGYTAEQIVGKSYALLFPAEDRDQGVPEEEMEAAGRTGTADNTRWLVRKNGERYWAEGTLIAMRDSEGVLTGFAKIIRDATDRRTMQERLRTSQQRLRLALHAARMGTWEWEIETDKQILDDGLRALFGLPPERAVNTIDEFFALLHPEDEERVRAAFDQTRKEGIHLDTEFRVIRPDGTERWLMDQGEVFYNEEGRPARLAGACVDITERKEAEQALRRSEQRFRLFASNLRDYALFQVDLEGHITSWNGGAERVLGYSEADILGQLTARIFVPEDVASGEDKKEIREATTTGRAEDFRWHLRKDGSRFWSSGVLTAIRDEGELIGFAKLMRDETERRKAEEQMSRSLQEKEVLLQEIHHRVKNNLQVIISLLSLQAEMVGDDRIRSVLDDASNRVRTIGEMHELLYRSPDLARIEFDIYLRRLGENLFTFYGVDSKRINLTIEPHETRLEIVQAIPCGLIANELLTNSLKHAFQDGRSGTIRVSLNCQDKHCVLEVVDDGVGLPKGFDIDESSSLGMKLVRVLARQLGGELVVRSERNTSVAILFSQASRGEDSRE